MSAIGTKWTYRDDLLFVRFRGEADMHGSVASTASAVIDPERTLRTFVTAWGTIDGWGETPATARTR